MLYCVLPSLSIAATVKLSSKEFSGRLALYMTALKVGGRSFVSTISISTSRGVSDSKPSLSSALTLNL